MIHRIRYEDLELLPDSQIIDMATKKRSGSLADARRNWFSRSRQKGRCALVERSESAVPIFEANVENYIASTCERSDVDTVLIDGKVVLEQGEFTTLDEEGDLQ